MATGNHVDALNILHVPVMMSLDFNVISIEKSLNCSPPMCL